MTKINDQNPSPNSWLFTWNYPSLLCNDKTCKNAIPYYLHWQNCVRISLYGSTASSTADQPVGLTSGWVSWMRSSAQRFLVPVPAGRNDFWAAESSRYLRPGGSLTCEVCGDGRSNTVREGSWSSVPAGLALPLGGWTPVAWGTQTAPGKGDILLRAHRGDDLRQGVSLGTLNNPHKEKHLSHEKLPFFLSYTCYHNYSTW